MADTQHQHRWYPSSDQWKDPASAERTGREILRLHYEMVDQFNEFKSKVKPPEAPIPSTKPVPSSNSAAVTNILGLPIFPSDTTQLADGTKLTWVAASRRFEFLP